MRKILLLISSLVLGLGGSVTAQAQESITTYEKLMEYAVEGRAIGLKSANTANNGYLYPKNFNEGATHLDIKTFSDDLLWEVIKVDEVAKTYKLKLRGVEKYLAVSSSSKVAYVDNAEDAVVLLFSDTKPSDLAGTDAARRIVRANNSSGPNLRPNNTITDWVTATGSWTGFYFYGLTEEQIAYYSYDEVELPPVLPENLPTNALGYHTFYTDYPAAEHIPTLNAAIDQLPFDAIPTELPTLSELQAAVENVSSNPTDITDGGLYRLINKSYPTYKMTAHTNGTKVNGTTADAISNVVQFVAAGDGTYYIKIQGRGTKITGGSNTTGAGGAANLLEGNGHRFTPANEGPDFTFTDAEYEGSNEFKTYHMSSSYDVVGWRAAADASKWYVVPVEVISVSLNTAADGKKYATLGLPFNAQVRSTEDVTVYQGESKDSYVTMTEVADKVIPAGEGVLLVSETAGSVTLNVADPAESTADFANNCLEATCVQMTGATPIYVFGQSNDEVGFYTLASAGTLAANRAYITKTADAAAMRLVFGGNVTGIESIDNGQLTIDNDAPIYDLSGRRVLAPAKGGIYVKGGKKFIVK